MLATRRTEPPVWRQYLHAALAMTLESFRASSTRPQRIWSDVRLAFDIPDLHPLPFLGE